MSFPLLALTVPRAPDQPGLSLVFALKVDSYQIFWGELWQNGENRSSRGEERDGGKGDRANRDKHIKRQETDKTEGTFTGREPFLSSPS